MILDAQQIYNKLTTEYNLVGAVGKIDFTLKDIKVAVESKDTVGNHIQEWFKKWLERYDIYHGEPEHTQSFPDFFLNPNSLVADLLEVKAFNFKKGPGFDIAQFNTYSNSLLTHAYRLDSNYLIIAYSMTGANIKINKVWLKKVWQISGGSGPWPMKVQAKHGTIENIRPVTWYSTHATFKPFETKEQFLKALNETRYQYPATHYENAHWLNNVLANYRQHTGIQLIIT